MELHDEDIKLLAMTALNAAQKAGELIALFVGEDIAVIHKKEDAQGVGDSEASHVLTEVDTKCQDIILETLASSIHDYDLALLSEEAVDDGSRFEKDYFWCIDPLDGTLPFIHKQSGFSVSIALVNKAGTSVLGVIYDPLTKTSYHAIKGKGAWRNGKPFMVQDSQISDLTFINDRSFLKQANADKITRQIRMLFPGALKTIMHGGAAMNAIWVLENAPACYIKFPKKERGGGSIWDFAATACIASEAGAYVSDMKGEVLMLNPQNTTFMNENGVLFVSNHSLADVIIQYYSSSDTSNNRGAPNSRYPSE